MGPIEHWSSQRRAAEGRGRAGEVVMGGGVVFTERSPAACRRATLSHPGALGGELWAGTSAGIGWRAMVSGHEACLAAQS